jgi:hypothetical protein
MRNDPINPAARWLVKPVELAHWINQPLWLALLYGLHF